MRRALNDHCEGIGEPKIHPLARDHSRLLKEFTLCRLKRGLITIDAAGGSLQKPFLKNVIIFTNEDDVLRFIERNYCDAAAIIHGAKNPLFTVGTNDLVLTHRDPW